MRSVLSGCPRLSKYASCQNDNNTHSSHSPAWGVEGVGSHWIQAALKIRKPADKRVLKTETVNLPASLQTRKDGQLRKRRKKKKITEGQNEFVRESFPITTLWQVMLVMEEFPNISFFSPWNRKKSLLPKEQNSGFLLIWILEIIHKFVKVFTWICFFLNPLFL